MIYSIVGTQKVKRSKALSELSALGEVTNNIYSEHAGSLVSHIDATPLFGDPVIIWCIQLGETAGGKEVLVTLLEKMKESVNIFIIDEPYADTHLSTKLKAVSKQYYDAQEEKVKDGSVFELCDSFARRDKKQAWIDFMKIRDTHEGEAIQGALWWKFQLVWQGVHDGAKSAFSLADCERIGGDILKSSIRAHRGEIDLMTELERIILSL